MRSRFSHLIACPLNGGFPRLFLATFLNVAQVSLLSNPGGPHMFSACLVCSASRCIPPRVPGKLSVRFSIHSLKCPSLSVFARQLHRFMSISVPQQRSCYTKFKEKGRSFVMFASNQMLKFPDILLTKRKLNQINGECEKWWLLIFPYCCPF